MNTSESTIYVIIIFALAIAIAAAFLLRSKSKIESNLRAEISNLLAKLNNASKAEGVAEELARTLDACRTDKADVMNKLEAAKLDINRLIKDLSTTESERDSARTNANDRVQTEKDACTSIVEREKLACFDLITKEKDACADVLAAKDRELEAKDAQITNLKDFIEKANETLGTQFETLSQKTLKDVSAQFEISAKKVIDQNSETTSQNVKLHKEQIELMLQPMGITLKSLDQQVKDTNEKRGEAEAVLMSKIKDFAGANEKLANALNKPVIRGSFAETKLESLLEAAGLVRGESFDLQVPVKDGDQVRIVDALVDMAQGKKLVIDSKNLLVPFVEYANAPEEEKAARLSDFQRAFKATLKALSIKDYSKHWEGIDAVIMFLPDEGMYMAAIESDRQLIATMFEHRVFTVSPVSLLPILKSVAYILGLEKQNRDTQSIVEAGRAIYEALGVILGKVKVLGDKLEDGVEAYNGVIASFEGNVLPKTRTLRQLGISRGVAHRDISVIDPQRRDFKDRIVKELALSDQAPVLQDTNGQAGLEVGA